jgi:non-ribosomal peptide synthase protein (TIGR01720 family)
LKGASELLPGYKLNSGRDTVGSTRQIALTLPASVTAPLLYQVAAAFHARINDVLLAGFVLSILNWRRRNSQEGTSVLIDLEGHGREAIVDGLDLSRTVGFFTTIFPVRLDPASVDPGSLDLEQAWAGSKALGDAVKAIKEQLAAVPDNGIGYGLLRYLNPETVRALSELPESQIDFNYLGRFPATNTGDWGPSESLTGGIDPDMPYHHALEVDSMVLDHSSGPELTATWSWLFWKCWFNSMRNLGSQDSRPLTCRWLPSRNLKLSAWKANTGKFRIFCRSPLCKRECSSSLFTMSQHRIFTTSRCCSLLKGQ